MRDAAIEAMKNIDELLELTEEGRVPIRKEDRKKLRDRLEVVRVSVLMMTDAHRDWKSQLDNKVKKVILDTMLEEEDEST